MVLKGVESDCVFKDVLILHDNVEYNEAGRTRCEVHPAFVVLVLAKEQLSILAFVQGFEEQASHKYSDSLVRLEGEPESDKIAQVR